MGVHCTSCGHDNPAHARFCLQCGGQLSVPCEQCGELLPPNARFCLQCGGPARPSVPPPAPTADGERRHLTVLFCDLVGSTAIAERLDAEDWRDTVVRFQQEVIGVIEQAGGYVAQHLGDGLLVYFGYPRAREDDTERALRCGLALVRATRSLNPELQALYDVELSLRVGLHTGPVVVSEVGGTRRETLALGNTANVAARVQGAAEPDTVLITGATLRRVQRLFVTEDRGEQPLKGIEKPVQLHAVTQPSGTRDRFERTSHQLTPFVGRSEQLARIDASFALASTGSGRAIAISGEAGMGKSRLVHAFRQNLEGQPHVWHECRAAAYNCDSPLQPWLQLQRELIGIGSAGSAVEKLRRLEQSVHELGFDPTEAVPLFATLHGLELTPDFALPPLSPLGLRKRTLSLLAEWVLRLSRKESTVLLIEDLHWLDPSSVELLGLLLARIEQAPLLLLLTYRPDFAPTWGTSQTVTELALERLDGRDLRMLVTSATSAGVLPDAWVDAIASRSDGVPLFAEELTRAVATEAQAAAPEALAIPDTLEDSLMARLEQTGEVKELAQLGSVFGREFTLELLEALWTREPPAMHLALRRAEEARVLLRVNDGDEVLYFFRHALIRDAAYNSLLRRTRRRLHGKVAETLRTRHPQTVREQPELLAHHLTQAHQLDAAIDAWRDAGARALSRAAHEEAIRHLRRARELLSERQSDSRALDVEQMLGGALVVARGWAHDETREAWEAAARLCDPDQQPLRAGAIACGLGDVYSSTDLAKSLARFETLVEDGRRRGLPLLTIAGHQGAAIPLRYLGRYAEARQHLDAGLAIYDPEQHRFMESGFHEEKGISLLCWSAWLHWDVGALDAAQRDAARAMEIAERLQNPFAMCFAGSWAAIMESWCCNWERAIELGAAAATRAAEQGFVLLEAMGRFGELSGRGILEGMEEAADLFGLEIQRLAATGNTLGGAEVFAVLANLLLEQGRSEQALGAIEMGLGLSSAMQQPWCDAWLLTLKARTLIEQGDGPAGEQLLRRALLVARSQGARSYELRAATALAELLHARADDEEARDSLRPSVGAFHPAMHSVELERARQLMSLLD
ncbi:MAG: AAA family ATPase [Myxococcales bacterium]|nr:AAA family ATPase [Myxococcales bacterium]